MNAGPNLNYDPAALSRNSAETISRIILYIVLDGVLSTFEISKTVHELLSSEKRSKIFLYLKKPDIFIFIDHKYYYEKNERILLSHFYLY